MDSGNGKTNDLLERIAQGVELIAERVDRVETRLERVEANQQETNAELRVITGRLDNMIGFLGSHHRDHEQRIAALEAHVFKKSG